MGRRRSCGGGSGAGGRFDSTGSRWLEYFLEVEVAIEAATVSTAGTRFTQVLYYAENDAFLFDGS